MAILKSKLAANVVAMAAVTALFLAYLGFDEEMRDEAEEQTTQVEANTPDVFGTDIQFNQLLENGRLHYRLQAKTIRQYVDENLTRMEIPHVHLRSETQPPWDIYSQEGFIQQLSQPKPPEDIVFLRSQVRMLQDHPVNGTITLRSESFYLYPNRQYAQTEDDVIIDTQVGRTTAAGLTADLDTGILTLVSNQTQRVHTIVLPEQFKKG